MTALFRSDLDTQRLIMGIALYIGKKNNPSISIRTSISDYEREEWLISLPVYVLEDLETIVEPETESYKRDITAQCVICLLRVLI